MKDFNGGHRCIKCKKEYIGHSSEHGAPKAPTGDEDWRTIVEAYPDARLWEHTPGDWQIAAGTNGEIKTYGHKTAEAAIATVARRIRAMNIHGELPPRPDPDGDINLESGHYAYYLDYKADKHFDRLERQLKAEIAAKKGLHTYIKDLNILLQKAEKERDAALEEVKAVKRGNFDVGKLYDEAIQRENELADERDQLKAERDAALEEVKKQKDRREHTHNWYASHYGKLQDWARKILPEPHRNEFFSCIANGSYHHSKDVGEPYICKAGFRVVPTNYFRMDTAEGQIIRDQTKRAEDAEAERDQLKAELDELRKQLAIVKEEGR